MCLINPKLGTINIKRNSSSETLREDNIKELNILKHLKHHSPQSFSEWGSYLAGLYEGDGYMSTIPQIVIVFSERDQPLAQRLMLWFGHGHVLPLKIKTDVRPAQPALHTYYLAPRASLSPQSGRGTNAPFGCVWQWREGQGKGHNKIVGKRAYKWVISNNAGVIKFLSLIDGHIRTQYKLDQVNNSINLNKKSLSINFQNTIDNSDLDKSWWLAGYSDADSYFYIQILNNRKPSDTVRIQYKFSLKDRTILEQLKSLYGSTIGTRTHPNGLITYYWSSSTNPRALLVYAYFHKYSLQSSKWLDFFIWRKAIRLVQEKAYLTPKGLDKIRKLKAKMELIRAGKVAQRATLEAPLNQKG
jgi:LAGLIDADG endonuclease